MKVAHIRATNFFGGPEKQILNLCEGMDGIDSMVCSFVEYGAENQLLVKAEGRGIPAIGVPQNRRLEFAMIGALRRAIRTMNIDVICTHDYKSAIIGELARRGLPVRRIHFLRGFTGENWKVRMFEKAESLFLRLADAAVAVSEYQAAHFLRGMSVPWYVLRNSVEPKAFTRSWGRRRIREDFDVPEKNRIIATAGRLSREKDQETFLRAANRVLTEKGDVTFMVFGEGPARAKLERIGGGRVGREVIFAGFREKYVEYLPGFDLFVLTSLQEGMPNVILEAFSAGVPVVSTGVGGVTELVEDAVTGFLVPVSDPVALAERLLGLLTEPVLLDRVAGEAKTKVEREFSVKGQRARAREVFLEVAAI